MSENKDLLKNYLYMIVGSLFIGFGVAFVIKGDIGGDSLTTLEQGLARTFNTSVAFMQMMANIFFVLILYFSFKDRVSLSTLISPFMISSGNYIMSFIIKNLNINSMYTRVLTMLLGILIIGIGIGIGAQSPSSSNPYDSLVLGLSEKFNISYPILRPICDAFLLIIGILLKGSWGIGTIVAIFLQGYIANLFIKLLNSIL